MKFLKLWLKEAMLSLLMLAAIYFLLGGLFGMLYDFGAYDGNWNAQFLVKAIFPWAASLWVMFYTIFIVISVIIFLLRRSNGVRQK